jgi:hypothetical protein
MCDTSSQTGTLDPLVALLVADYGRGVIYRIQARGKR